MTVFAVANTALINMLMASRLVYGMAKQEVLPRGLSKVLPHRRSPWMAILFTTVLALALILVVSNLAESSVTALSGTTALLLLCVFAVVNVCVVVIRGKDGPHSGFRAPSWTPFVAAVACLYLAGPWARTDEQMVQYKVAGAMIGVGLVLWVVTALTNKAHHQPTDFEDIDHLGRLSAAPIGHRVGHDRHGAHRRLGVDVRRVAR